METSNLIELLDNGSQEEIRSKVFTLEGGNIEDQPLFPHQMETMRNIYKNGNRSGIIRYPTGGGKTRTALAYIAKEMERQDRRKFLWVTYPTDVLRQGMVRTAELAGEFSDDTKIAWYDTDMKQDRELLEEVDILFIMRDQFTRLMEHALDGRVKNNPLLRVYDKGRKERSLYTSVIYDESHQLGAEKLQEQWDQFTRNFSIPNNIHTIGLSATPIPTEVDRSYLLANKVFPLPGDGSVRGDRPEWNMLCHHDVSFSDLQKQDVLCEMDRSWDERDDFDITVQCPGIKPLGSNPTKKEVKDFVSQFNQRKIERPEVVGRLAEDVSKNFEELGKTLIFCPTIHAANRLLGEMRTYENLEGRCSMVHSKLGEFHEKDIDIDISNRNSQIQEFKARGDDPCVMVNVGMLTTGFDDPQIQSVILARLTQSNNLFWQMIGRGLRGPAVGGTKSCSIIDPIQLGKKFQVFEGYRATIDDKRDDYRDILEKNPNQRVSEVISTTESGVSWAEEKELPEDVRKKIQAALQEFVDYETFETAVHSTEQITSLDWCEKLIQSAEADLKTNLSWMRRKTFLPNSDSDTDLKNFHRKVEVCREKGIETEKEWKNYVTSVI